MDLDPVVVEIKPPKKPFKLPKLPSFGNRTTKIIVAVSAIAIVLSLVVLLIFTVLVNNEKYKKSRNIVTVTDEIKQSTTTEKSDEALPGGGKLYGKGGSSGPNAPDITFTAEPGTVDQGGKTKLTWSATKNPKSCVASGDWSGDKSASGNEITPSLSEFKIYHFIITCKTDKDTAYRKLDISVVQQQDSTSSTSSGTSSAAATSPDAPVVNLSVSDAVVYTGYSATITWEATNSPTSCTASGDWSGTKSGSGSVSTGILNTIKTYTYSIVCENSAGKSKLTSIQVQVDQLPADIPVTAIYNNPASPVILGTNVTLTWSATNSPSSCTASGDWSGAKAINGTQNTGALNTIKTYAFTISCSNNAGTTIDTASITVVPNPPGVSLTVSPNSIFVGNSSTISWSATNNPSSCTASGDWSGQKVSNGTVSGTASTGTLNTARMYYYSLSCTNQGGTTNVNNVSLNVTVPPAPVVSISANPISINTGNSSTINWSVTNNPTSCTASGDWSGPKASNGPVSTGPLTVVKTYTYTLSCSNAGGSNSATTSVAVSSGAAPVNPPVITIAATPTTIGTGSSSTISWSATNNPTSCTASGSWSGSKAGSGSTSTNVINTAGTYTYTLNCSNSAGSDTKSATVTAIAIPVITISVTPSSINTGSSATINWSATNSPSSCTAGGSWTGSKGATGSQTTGTMNTAGSYVYSLSCTNAGGTGSASATLTVSNPAPVYCGGLTPCYGPSDLALHASAGNCWAWNLNWVMNITSFRPTHKGGQSAGTLESSVSVCNHNINSILAGTAAISGYRDSGGSTTHNHATATKNNTASSQMLSYRVGYYDATKP